MKQLISTCIAATASMMCLWAIAIEVMIKASMYYGANQAVYYLQNTKTYILFSLLCFYVLIFTFIVKRLEKKQ